MRYTIFNTPLITGLLRLVAIIGLKISGWRVVGDRPKIPRYVVIGAPHTSNMDFFVAMALALSSRTHIHWLGKDSLFKGPMGWVMRWFGGIPVVRGQRNNLVKNTAAAFRRHKRFVLAIAPEGTRAKVTQWKTGFYHIAQGANVPIVLAFADFRRKIMGYGQVLQPSGDIERDMCMIRSFYAEFTGKHPHRFCLPK